jgi:hypothetical protein
MPDVHKHPDNPKASCIPAEKTADNSIDLTARPGRRRIIWHLNNIIAINCAVKFHNCKIERQAGALALIDRKKTFYWQSPGNLIAWGPPPGQRVRQDRLRTRWLVQPS